MATILGRQFRLLSIALILVSLVLVSSCASAPGYGTPSAIPSSPAPGSAVTIANLSFSPASITVKAGTTVTWTNKDSTAHTVTSDNGAFESGNLAPNAAYSFTFSNTGTFAYYCSIHPSMKGTVVVQ